MMPDTCPNDALLDALARAGSGDMTRALLVNVRLTVGVWWQAMLNVPESEPAP